MFSCNLLCLLIFLHGRSRTYRVASLHAGPVGRISYNLYFDCKHVRYVTCDFNKRIYFFYSDIHDFDSDIELAFHANDDISLHYQSCVIMQINIF